MHVFVLGSCNGSRSSLRRVQCCQAFMPLPAVCILISSFVKSLTAFHYTVHNFQHSLKFANCEACITRYEAFNSLDFRTETVSSVTYIHADDVASRNQLANNIKLLRHRKPPPRLTMPRILTVCHITH